MSVYQQVDPCEPRHCVEWLYWKSLLAALSELVTEFASKVRDLPLLDGMYPGDPRFPLELRYPRAIDSHCHLSSLTKGDITQFMAESFVEAREAFGEETPLVVGVVNNRVFPKEWRTTHAGRHIMEATDEPGTAKTALRIVETMGVHPAVKPEVISWDGVTSLSQSDSIIAIGECGLDFFKSSPGQRMKMRKQIRMAKIQKKPLVFHLRPGRSGMSTVLGEALAILDGEKVGSEYPMHLHSFVGSQADMCRWTRKYPHSIFGVSVASIQSEHAASFAKLGDLRKIVLESDAPHSGWLPREG
jgi:Tat protein secretion system quality control protein TatD with DNase activity